jgi:PAS domain S-box-containing protein
MSSRMTEQSPLKAGSRRPETDAPAGRAIALVIGMAIAYALAAELGHALTLGAQPLFATFWPASGLYLAALLLVPRAAWPLVVLGAALGNLASDILIQGRAPLVVAGFVVANAAEALVAAWLLSRIHEPGRWRIESLRDGLWLGVSGVLAGPAAGALLGAATVTIAYGASFGTSFPVWWAADAVGVVLVTPALVALGGTFARHSANIRPAVRAYLNQRSAELVALLLAVAATMALVLAEPSGVPMVYLLLPTMLWAAMRFGVGGNATVNVLISLSLVFATVFSYGPFAAMSLAEQQFVLQTLLSAYAGTGLLVALLFLERRRAESSLEARVQERTEALSESEGRYRAIVEMSNEAICVILEDRIAYCNDAFARLIGASSRAQVIGTDPQVLVPPDQRQSVSLWMQRIAESDASRVPAVERRLLRLDGEEVEVESSVAVYDAAGARGLQVLVRDITERKRVERALWTNRERMKLALKAARMYVFELDVVSGKSVRSTEAASVVGLLTNVATPISDFAAHVHPDDRDRFLRRHDGLRTPEDTLWARYRYRHPDGYELVLEEFGRGAFDGDNRLVTVVGVIVDVTDREAMLSQLRMSEERFATLADAMPAMLMTLDANGRCGYVNPTFVTLTGLDLAAARGDGWLEAVDPGDRGRLRRGWRNAVRHGKGYSVEYRLLMRDGSSRWFKSAAVPVRGATDAVMQWISVALDVEDQKRTQAELQEADRRKDEYLAMLAHELRNPLAPIRNAGALLLRKIAPDEPVRPAVEMIDRQSRHLSRLVDELLDVSRVTRGKIRLDIQTVDLAIAVRNGIEAALPGMDRRRQGLELRLPPPGTFLQVDVVRFAQVVANLLDNASKFSPEGSPVRLEAKLAGESVVFEVSDQGEGIAPELLGGVFDLFTQAQGPLDRSTGGLGIGLALVKSLVELHGGTVSAASEGRGRGATFTVRLPLKVSESLLPGAGDSSDSDGHVGLVGLEGQVRPDAASVSGPQEPRDVGKTTSPAPQAG